MVSLSFHLHDDKEKVESSLTKWNSQDPSKPQYYTLKITDKTGNTADIFMTEENRQELLKTLAGEDVKLSEWS